jgi:hypothetical protein
MQVLEYAAQYRARKRASEGGDSHAAQAEAQLPRAILADMMFSVMEYKPMQSKLRLVPTPSFLIFLCNP